MSLKRKRRSAATTIPIRKKSRQTENGDTESEGLVGLENSMDPAKDPGAYKAISTIERLSRKYLLKSPNISAVTRGTIDVLTPKENIPEATCSDESVHSSNELNTEKKQRLFDLKHKVKKEPKHRVKRRLAKNSRNTNSPEKRIVTKRSPRNTNCEVRLVPLRVSSLLSPGFKVPKPTLGHSTPSNVGNTPKKDDSLFGFEALDTPLPISPVFPEIDDFSPSTSISKSPEQSPVKLARRVSFSKVDGVYSVPSHKAQTRRKKLSKKKSEWHLSEVKEWVEQLNTQFDEVDDFELAVE